MKKILAILLVCIFAFTCVACENGGDESSTAGFTNSGTTSKKEESKIDASSKVESSEAESSEVSVDPKDEIVFTQKFMSWKRPFYAKKANGYDDNGIQKLTANDTTSLNFSKVNEDVAEYDIGIFTSTFGASIQSDSQDYADFAVAVFEYNHAKFGFVKTAFYNVGKADAATAIPKDGWVVAVHKEYADKIAAIEKTAADVVFFAHGIPTNNALDTIVLSAGSAPVLDGVVSAGEYGSAIWEIKPENENVSYAQFEVNNYYATAEVYLTYDKDYLYGAVIVNSPMHDCPLSPDQASSMWQYECIQVNVAGGTADGSYMHESVDVGNGKLLERWDNPAFESGDETTKGYSAGAENMMRQYGFAVSNADGYAGETLKCVWIGTNYESSQAQAKVVRNSNSTVYEFAIPWTELGKADDPLKGEVGTELGFSLSVNCGNSSNENSSFKNITLRDGGGIIGRNDWTKIPVITLG